MHLEERTNDVLSLQRNLQDVGLSPSVLELNAHAITFLQQGRYREAGASLVQPLTQLTETLESDESGLPPRPIIILVCLVQKFRDGVIESSRVESRESRRAQMRGQLSLESPKSFAVVVAYQRIIK